MSCKAEVCVLMVWWVGGSSPYCSVLDRAEYMNSWMVSACGRAEGASDGSRALTYTVGLCTHNPAHNLHVGWETAPTHEVCVRQLSHLRHGATTVDRTYSGAPETSSAVAKDRHIMLAPLL